MDKTGDVDVPGNRRGGSLKGVWYQPLFWASLLATAYLMTLFLVENGRQGLTRGSRRGTLPR